MPKTTHAAGSSHAGYTRPPNPGRQIEETLELVGPTSDIKVARHLYVGGDLSVAGNSAFGPAASTEVGYAQITADVTGIVIDTLNLDAVSGLNLVIPDLAVPVYLEARVNVSHSVANAAVYCGIGLSSATIVTGLLCAAFQLLNIIGSKATMAPKVRLPAHSAGTYQLFVLGDAGTAAVRAAAYFPSWINAVTA